MGEALRRVIGDLACGDIGDKLRTKRSTEDGADQRGNQEDRRNQQGDAGDVTRHAIEGIEDSICISANEGDNG